MMETCCPLWGFDGDIDFYYEEFVRARKVHKCCECQWVINIGERYQRASGKCEGALWSEKTCETCGKSVV